MKTPFRIVKDLIEDQCSFCGRNEVFDMLGNILVTSNSIDTEEMEEILSDILDEFEKNNHFGWTGSVSHNAILLSEPRDKDYSKKYLDSLQALW